MTTSKQQVTKTSGNWDFTAWRFENEPSGTIYILTRSRSYRNMTPGRAGGKVVDTTFRFYTHAPEGGKADVSTVKSYREAVAKIEALEDAATAAKDAADRIALIEQSIAPLGTVVEKGTTETASDANLCRICKTEPAFEDGVCRWESCEKEAAR